MYARDSMPIGLFSLLPWGKEHGLGNVSTAAEEAVHTASYCM